MNAVVSDTAVETLSPAPSEPTGDGMFVMAPLRLIEVTGTQPRRRFDQSAQDELTDSVRAHGVLQPLLLRPREPRGWQLVAGERRLRAAAAAGLHEVPAMVRTLTDVQMLEVQLVENLHRRDLHELEEAEGYERLMRECGHTVEEIAHKCARSTSYIYARLKLCALCTQAREAFYAGKLTASTALLVARIPSEKLQIEATKTITQPSYSSEPMSYRAAADHVQRHFMLQLEGAPFKPADPTLVPGAGSCRDCPKRSGNDRDLFPDVSRADVCTDPVCFNEKRAAHIERLREAAKANGGEVLTGKAAQKVLKGSYGLQEGYVDLNENAFYVGVNDAGMKSVKAVLGKSAPAPIIVERPDGELVYAARRADVEAALQAKGIQTRKSLSPGRSDDAARKRKQARALATRAALYDAIVGAASADELTEQQIRSLQAVVAEGFFRALDSDSRKRLAKRRGWTEESTPDELARLSISELALFLVACAIAPELYAPAWSTEGKPARMEELAELLGLDAAAITKRALDELTAANRAKAKSGKTAAKPRKGAAAAPAAEPAEATPKAKRGTRKARTPKAPASDTPAAESADSAAAADAQPDDAWPFPRRAAAPADEPFEPFGAPHDHVCGKCRWTFRSDLPGARWTNASGNPRYVHPGCSKGAKPGRDWTPWSAPTNAPVGDAPQEAASC